MVLHTITQQSLNWKCHHFDGIFITSDENFVNVITFSFQCWQGYIIGQKLNLPETPICPLWASYGVFIVNILNKIDCTIYLIQLNHPYFSSPDFYILGWFTKTWFTFLCVQGYWWFFLKHLWKPLIQVHMWQMSLHLSYHDDTCEMWASCSTNNQCLIMVKE